MSRRLVCIKQLDLAATTLRRWRRVGLLPPPTIKAGIFYYDISDIERARETLARGADALLVGGRRRRGRPRLEELIEKGGAV